MGNLPEDIFKIPKREALAETVANSIARAIANGLLKPGERVIEAALAERIDVSRAPVREALKVLHTQGILTSDGNRGFRVALFDDRAAERVMEIRLSLETILLRDAIGNWRKTDPEATVLDAAIDEMKHAADNNDLAASLNADLSFHEAIAEAAENSIAYTLWMAIARNVMIIFSLKKYRADDLHAVVKHHEEFRDLIREQIRHGLKSHALKTKLEDHLFQVARLRMAKQSDPVLRA